MRHLIMPSRVEGISKGPVCGGMYDGGGGNLVVLARLRRGASLRGSTCFLYVVKISGRSAGLSNGRSRLLRSQQENLILTRDRIVLIYVVLLICPELETLPIAFHSRPHIVFFASLFDPLFPCHPDPNHFSSRGILPVDI